MKGNSKKLASFVVIAGILMFATVAMAGDYQWYPPIYGKYAFTGSGNCAVVLVDSQGKVLSKLSTIIQIWEGNYTFDGHDSGSFEGIFRAVDVQNNYATSMAKASWVFKYKMTDYNRFETYLKPGTYDKVEDVPASGNPPAYFDIVGDRFHGAVERDGGSIVVTSGPPMIHYLCDPTQPLCVHSGVEALCSESVIGLRVFE